MKNNLRWMKLDNSAKIYPAARSGDWTNVFRISATFDADVDPDILQLALDHTVKRFPSIAARIRAGMFWYYIEELPEAPKVLREEDVVLDRMSFKDIKKCAFRVLYYKNRMSVEFFHSMTDGNGGLIFVKTLAAEYVRLRYGEDVPCENGIFDINETPDPEELEDSFLKYVSDVNPGWKDEDAYKITGTPEDDGFMHVTCGTLNAEEIHKMAKEKGVTVNTFLTAVLMKSLYDLQNDKVPNRLKRRLIKVLIPVNLRSLLPSKTMRNFVLYITPQIDPRLGDFTLDEMIKIVHHKMGHDMNDKYLAAKFTPNVRSEQMKILRIMPLFIKNVAMKMVYSAVGERKACLAISNIGVVSLPENMQKHITRMDFIIRVQATTPCNCAVIGYNGKIYVNFVRNIKESELERRFFTTLRQLGARVYVDSNQR